VKPILQALLLADKVYEDKATGKKIVAGIFSRILTVPNCGPTTHVDADGKKTTHIQGGMHAGSPSVYVSLVDCKGKLSITLRFVDLQDNNVLLQANLEVDCDDPLATVELVIPMPQLVPPHHGVFALELLCGDEPLGSLRITTAEISREGNQ